MRRGIRREKITTKWKLKKKYMNWKQIRQAEEESNKF